jgi:capsular polysaccharide biosynthesis protein
MNLTYYVRIMIRRGWIMLLAMIITAGAAYGFSKAQTPVYRASQRVLFQPARNDFGLTETLRTVLRSYVVYLNTDTQAAAAIDRLNLDMQPGELRRHTTINSDPTQLMIQIDVDMEDGKLAADIAHELGLLLFEYKTQQNSGLRREDRIDPVMIDRAGWNLHSPNTKINTLAGAVLGLLLGGVIVFALEYLESNIVRSKDDIERFLDLPVLAAIPADDTRA